MTPKSRTILKPEYYFAKILFALIVNCSLLIGNCVSQQSITWQKLFDGPNGGNQEGYDICQSITGNFYAVVTDLGQQPARILVLKINPYGDTLWRKTISSDFAPMRGYSILSTNDNGCILTGSLDSSFAIKLDSSGNIVWKKTYISLQSFCVNIIGTQDGGFIICGGIDYTKGYILKIDSLGNLLWQRIYTSGYSRFYESIEIAYDGGYLLAGHSIDAFADTIKLLLTKIDDSGNIVWEKKLKVNNRFARGRKILRLNNQYYIAGLTSDTLPPHISKSFLYKLDINGNVNFLKILNTQNSEQFQDFALLSNNRLIICVEKMDGSAFAYPELVLTDTSLNIIRQTTLNVPYYSVLRSLKVINNNNTILVGEGDFGLFFDDVYVIRIDSLFSVPSFIPVSSNQELVPADYELSQNYPNPFNPVTKIKFAVPVNSLITLTLYDLLGEEIVQLVNKELSPGFYEVDWKPENLASGVYFYALESGNFKDVKKMVLLK